MSPVRVCFANLTAPALDGSEGLDPARFGTDLADRFEGAHREVSRRREAGEMGFFELPSDASTRTGVQEVADSFGQWFEAFVVVGIGGSSLGARAVAEALLGPGWNERSGEDREHFPRIHFLENPDPDTVRGLLARIDPRRTLFNVVSKSGSTAETMALFLVVEEVLRAAVGEDAARGHLIFTTDPEEGALRRMALTRGIPALPVPANVGGRFSVLSPVGLLPAAVTGVDIGALHEGAGAMELRCRSAVLRENPAGMLATLLHAADRELGRPIHVFMPYSDRLRAVAHWFQQLWAESLGKAARLDGGHAGTGPTPLASLGAVDQHSLLQLLMEGPPDKVVIFVRVRRRVDPVPVADLHPDEPALAFLGGHTLEHILESERRATVEALRRAGRPSLTLELESLDARALGGLFMLLQIATAYAGALYGVDPLDQPGVEAGKRLTYGLLGRGGFEAPHLRAEDADGFSV